MLPSASTAAAPKGLPGPGEQHNPAKRDFNNLDSLLEELNRPKELITATPTPGQSGAVVDSGDEIEVYGDEPREEISDEAAARSGSRIAKTLDKVLSLGVSVYAKNEDRHQYEADLGDIEDLSGAWSDVAKKYSFKIEDSPWFNLIILMIAVYTPIFIKAKGDRRDAILREEIREIEARQAIRNAEILEKINKIETAQAAA